MRMAMPSSAANVKKKTGGHPAESELWERVLKPQGAIFRTVEGKPLLYRVEGNGVYFERDGRVNKKMSRADFNKAVARLPLTKTTDINDGFDSAFLIALLTDPRIAWHPGLAA